ncbi:MAG: hypothetical protein Q4B01_09870 [Eubacteriales bacterium]|nr:hypothetical protein [Eubacteriales bacterium]
MCNLGLLKQDFKINRWVLILFYVLQTLSLCLAWMIRRMHLIQISDVFWDTIPTILIPAGLAIMLAYSTVLARKQDGTMDFLLTTPLNIRKIFRTKAVFVFLNLFLLLALSTGFGLLTKGYLLSGQWQAASYIRLNIGAFCLQFLISSYCLLISCSVRHTRSYTIFGVLLPVLMYGIYVIYYLNPGLQVLQFLSVFSLYRQRWYLTGNGLSYLGEGIFLAAGVAMALLAGSRFREQTAA